MIKTERDRQEQYAIFRTKYDEVVKNLKGDIRNIFAELEYLGREEGLTREEILLNFLDYINNNTCSL